MSESNAQGKVPEGAQNQTDNLDDDLKRAMEWVEELAARDEPDPNESDARQPVEPDSNMPSEQKPERAGVDQPRDSEMLTLQWPADGDQAAEVPESDGPPAPDPRLEQDSEGAQPVNNLEDAMAWLEKLAADRGMPIEEMPTRLMSDQDIDQYIPPAAIGTPQDESGVENMELLEDPISWLEQLARDQSSPLEELPSVADRLLASEIISQVVTPTENNADADETLPLSIPLEEALLFLEQVASDEGVTFDKVKISSVYNNVNLEAVLQQVDQLAAGESRRLPAGLFAVAAVKTAPVVKTPVDWGNLADEIPEDPDEALAWLENLTGEGDGVEEAVTAIYVAGVQAGIKTPTDAQDVLSPQGEADSASSDDDILAALPDDPDEAVAWMEQVAAQKVSSKAPQQDHAAAPPSQDEAPSVNQAAKLLESGEYDAALAVYKNLLQQGDDLEQVVKALETAVTTHPEIGRLRYLLGDAYLRTGRNQKAMEIYQQGFLDNL